LAYRKKGQIFTVAYDDFAGKNAFTVSTDKLTFLISVYSASSVVKITFWEAACNRSQRLARFQKKSFLSTQIHSAAPLCGIDPLMSHA
jgi:hypothetical protein